MKIDLSKLNGILSAETAVIAAEVVGILMAVIKSAAAVELKEFMVTYDEYSPADCSPGYESYATFMAEDSQHAINQLLDYMKDGETVVSCIHEVKVVSHIDQTLNDLDMLLSILEGHDLSDRSDREDVAVISARTADLRQAFG